MKKNLFLLGLAVAVEFIGCTTDTSSDEYITGARGTHTIKASISEDGTRTSLGDKGESSTPVLWSLNDQIAVVDPATHKIYEYLLDAESAGGKKGQFTAVEGDGAKGISPIVALYPHNNFQYMDDNMQMSLPASQTYTPNRSFATNLSPMYAAGKSADNLSFTHLAGVINLQLTSQNNKDIGRKVTKIILESGEHQLVGAYNLISSGQQGYALEETDASATNRKMTLTCGEGVELTETPTSFIFVVPAKQYAARDLKFTITIDAGNKGTSGDKTLTMTKPLTIARGQIINLNSTAMPHVVVVESTPENAAADITKAMEEMTDTNSTIQLKVTSNEETAPVVELPNVFDTPEKRAIPVMIELPAPTAANNSMTITAPATNAPTNVSINFAATDAATAPPVTITMPSSTVTLNGTFNAVTATTADNTLIIDKGASILSLTVIKGSVKIYGLVETIVKEQTAGTISRHISSTESLAQALHYDDKADVLYFDSSDQAIDGKGATLTKPATIVGSTKLSNLTMKASKGNNLTIGADNIDVLLTNITIYQTDNASNCAILASKYNDISLTLKDSHLVLLKSVQRGINIFDANKDTSVCTITLDNTHIGPKLEIMGEGKYTAEQNEIFKGLSDTRGVSIGAHKGKTIVNMINNSVIEGVFYAINSTQHSDELEVNVSNSRLDGRAALNIWNNGKGGVFNVTNSLLVGRNPFGGPTEEFAAIVVERNNGAWPGSANNVFNIKNSNIYCYNNPETDTNTQYAVSMRSPNKNTLNLQGTTTIYDKSESTRLPHAVDISNWYNEVNIDATVKMYGNEAATILPSNVWDGNSLIIPAKASDGKIYIGHPAELAGIITLSENSNKNVVLVRDLDLNEKLWEAKKLSSSVIDGAGHTIRNLNAINSQKSGLLSDGVSCTIKNLTLESAKINSVDDGSQNSYAGGFIGRSYGTTILENCTLKNSTVKGINKVGGLIGFNAENSVEIKDCTVIGSMISTDDTKSEHGQCGGILGYVGSVLKGTTSITNTRIIDSKVVSAPNETQTYRHNSIYVGSFQGTANDNLTINAPANAIQNSTLNGEAPDASKYNGLLGGVRYTSTLSTTTILTINGTRYTE